jgi:pSer/pThr/pTyr-binding forkhead associated (FHA) protein
VSKRHAKISMGGPGKLVVEDQQSGNGTWRDGQRIKCETFASGDVIKFGSAEFRLQLPGDRSPAPRNGMHPTVFNDSSGRDRSPPATPGPSERTWMLSGHDEKGMVIQFPLRPRSDGSETTWTIWRKSPQSDLVVQHHTVSSVHARVRYVPGRGVEICDLNSTNGTLVDGRRIGPDFVPLEGVRKIVLGECELNVSRT